MQVATCSLKTRVCSEMNSTELVETTTITDSCNSGRARKRNQVSCTGSETFGCFVMRKAPFLLQCGCHLLWCRTNAQCVCRHAFLWYTCSNVCIRSPSMSRGMQAILDWRLQVAAPKSELMFIVAEAVGNDASSY